MVQRYAHLDRKHLQGEVERLVTPAARPEAATGEP
jgi:hypothetical protein